MSYKVETTSYLREGACLPLLVCAASTKVGIRTITDSYKDSEQ